MCGLAYSKQRSFHRGFTLTAVFLCPPNFLYGLGFKTRIRNVIANWSADRHFAICHEDMEICHQVIRNFTLKPFFPRVIIRARFNPSHLISHIIVWIVPASTNCIIIDIFSRLPTTQMPRAFKMAISLKPRDISGISDWDRVTNKSGPIRINTDYTLTLPKRI